MLLILQTIALAALYSHFSVEWTNAEENEEKIVHIASGEAETFCIDSEILL